MKTIIVLCFLFIFESRSVVVDKVLKRVKKQAGKFDKNVKNKR